MNQRGVRQQDTEAGEGVMRVKMRSAESLILVERKTETLINFGFYDTHRY